MMHAERLQSWRLSSRLWPFRANEKALTVVDLGARKVACAILALHPLRFKGTARECKILGSAVVRSAGFAGGRIVNIAAVETCLRRAVAKAEAQAGITAEDVIVTGQFAGMSAEIFEAKLRVRQDMFLAKDVEAVTLAAEEHCASLQRDLLHIFGSSGLSDWQNAVPARESAPAREISAVSMPVRGVRQVAVCLKKSLLNPRGVVAGPVAAALSVSFPEERENGVLVLDMGAQSTGFALFQGGMPLFLEIVPQGGDQITEDIAKTFGLRKFEAERLKIKYGSVFDGLQADIDLPFTNGDTGEPVSKFAVNHLIRSRASSIFRAVNDRLKGAGYSGSSSGVVLTGGGSLLPGIQELASQVLIAEVRLGRTTTPAELSGDSALSALAGGCIYVCRHQSSSEIAALPESVSLSVSYASRISQWLRASF